MTTAPVRPASHKHLSDLKKAVGRWSKTSSKSTSAHPTYWLWQHPGLNKTSHTIWPFPYWLSALNMKYFCLVGSWVRGFSRGRTPRFLVGGVCHSDTPLLPRHLHVALTQGVAVNLAWQKQGFQRNWDLLYRKKDEDTTGRTIKKRKDASMSMLKWQRNTHSGSNSVVHTEVQCGIQWLTTMLMWALCLNMTDRKAADAHK